MQFFVFSYLINGLSSLLFGFWIFQKNRRLKENRDFFYLSLATGSWALCCVMWLLEPDLNQAIFWIKCFLISATFIPFFYLKWIINFLELPKNLMRRLILRSALLAAVFFLSFSFSSLYLDGVKKIHFFPYWPQAGAVYKIFIIYYFCIWLYATIEMLKVIKNKVDSRREKTMYVFWGTVFSFLGGGTSFPLMLGVSMLPFGIPLIFIYPLLFTIGIIKAQLFNVKIATAELLTFSVWIFLLIRLFLSENLKEVFINGGLFGLLIVFGILLIKSIYKEIEQREKIQQLSGYKSELISVVAHQIKNPLTVIKGYASLVKEETIKGETNIQQAISAIFASANKLIDLLNNLLDLGHLEDGKMHYEFENFELNKFLRNIVDDFQFSAKQKKLKLIFESAFDNVFISGDVLKLSQVFRNLLDNAIKYTDCGFVKVKTSDNVKDVLIEISDSGRGISKELLDKLFQRFSRGVEEKQIMGAGLGLYISKEIVKSHRGKIWAESKGEGKGSKISISLPH